MVLAALAFLPAHGSAQVMAPIASSQLQNMDQLKDEIKAYYSNGSYEREVAEIESDATRFIDLRIPLINNWQAREVRTGEEAREGLYQQVPNPVRWTEIIQHLTANGVTRWFEVGAGSALSGMLRSIVSDARACSGVSRI